MKKNKVLILSGLITILAGGMFLTFKGSVFADDAKRYPPIVQKIISKFNLDSNEVDKLMEEERAERQAQMQEKQANRQGEIEDRLNQAVQDGKINEDQKNEILAKLEELRPNKNHEPMNFSQMTAEEKQAKQEEMRTLSEKRRTEILELEEKFGIELEDILGLGEFGNQGFGMKSGGNGKNQ